VHASPAPESYPIGVDSDAPDDDAPTEGTNMCSPCGSNEGPPLSPWPAPETPSTATTDPRTPPTIAMPHGVARSSTPATQPLGVFGALPVPGLQSWPGDYGHGAVAASPTADGTPTAELLARGQCAIADVRALLPTQPEDRRDAKAAAQAAMKEDAATAALPVSSAIDAGKQCPAPDVNARWLQHVKPINVRQPVSTASLAGHA
jgi:hypothetical protein